MRGRGRSNSRDVERAAAHLLVCREGRICVYRFRGCAAERPYDILQAILAGLAHYQTPVAQNTSDGVTNTYRR